MNNMTEFIKGMATLLYLCDPEKNTQCSKTGCGECSLTTVKEYSKDGMIIDAGAFDCELVRKRRRQKWTR